MAFIECTYFSETLDLMTSVNVILPHLTHDQLQEKGYDYRYPVVYLLHGLSDDHTVWMRRTSIERHADEYGIAVVMPAVNRSFYNDMAVGNRYWTFVSQELPERMNHMFPLSTRRQDTFVAGLSMGGFGSFKLALHQPERFIAAASFSGAVDMLQHSTEVAPDWRAELPNIFGDLDKFKGSDNDLIAQAERMAKSGGVKPSLYLWCGTEDFLYEMNLSFERCAVQNGLDLLAEYGPGDHEWKYWDVAIERTFRLWKERGFLK